jgi:phosphomannomutase
MIVEAGGTPIITRVGHSLIKEVAINENAYFAGESSGHFFLNMELGCFEVPIIVIGKLLQEFSGSGMKVSEYVERYKKYFHSGEINSVVENKQNVFDKIEQDFNKYVDRY